MKSWSDWQDYIFKFYSIHTISALEFKNKKCDFDNSYSSTLLIDMSNFSTVRKAAKLAVYDEMMVSVNSHHTTATILVDSAFGFMLVPCWRKVPVANQRLFHAVN